MVVGQVRTADLGRGASPRSNDFLWILSELPRDLEATYTRFLRNIQPQHVRLAVELVHIIVGSLRPLTVDEVI